jgi:hypothetical protein
MNSNVDQFRAQIRAFFIVRVLNLILHDVFALQAAAQPG